jgi:hypothetical protein
MRSAIWCEVACGKCTAVIGWYYQNAESISKLKKATESWVFSEEYGNLCPECYAKIKTQKEIR